MLISLTLNQNLILISFFNNGYFWESISWKIIVVAFSKGLLLKVK